MLSGNLAMQQTNQSQKESYAQSEGYSAKLVFMMLLAMVSYYCRRG